MGVIRGVIKITRSAAEFIIFKFPQVRPRNQRRITPSNLVAGIRSKKFFGFVECDISVPDELRARFAQFPPIFKNAMVSIDDVGPVTKELCERYGYLNNPARTLISSFFGKEVVLTTNQIIWYLDHGKSP